MNDSVVGLFLFRFKRACDHHTWQLFVRHGRAGRHRYRHVRGDCEYEKFYEFNFGMCFMFHFMLVVMGK